MIQEKGKIVQTKMGTRGSTETESLLQAMAEPAKSEVWSQPYFIQNNMYMVYIVSI